MSISGTNFTQPPHATNDAQIQADVQEVTQSIGSLSLRKGLSDAHCAIIIRIDSEQSDGSIHKIFNIAITKSIKPEIIVQPLLRPRLDHRDAYAFRNLPEIKLLDNDIIAIIDSNKEAVFFNEIEKMNLLGEGLTITKLIHTNMKIAELTTANIIDIAQMISNALDVLEELDEKKDFTTIFLELRDMMNCLAKAHMFSRIVDPSINKEMNTFFAKVEASIDTIATRIIKREGH